MWGQARQEGGVVVHSGWECSVHRPSVSLACARTHRRPAQPLQQQPQLQTLRPRPRQQPRLPNFCQLAPPWCSISCTPSSSSRQRLAGLLQLLAVLCRLVASRCSCSSGLPSPASGGGSHLAGSQGWWPVRQSKPQRRRRLRPAAVGLGLWDSPAGRRTRPHSQEQQRWQPCRQRGRPARRHPQQLLRPCSNRPPCRRHPWLGVTCCSCRQGV